MVDKLVINDLVVETTIGCLDWERYISQSVIFNIEISYDSQLAGKTDKLENALDYSAVAKSITDLVVQQEFNLIEALAERTVSHLLEQFQINDVHLKLTKPGAIENAKAVTIEINRSA